MTSEQENKALWQQSVGQDAELLWDEMALHQAPPPRVQFESAASHTWWRRGAVAAALLALLLGGWTMQLQDQLESTRADYIAALLRVDSSAAQLTALSMLREQPMTGVLTEQVTEVVLTSRDPNVQLAAIDALLAQHVLADEDLESKVLAQIKHNQGFIRTSVRARDTRI